MIANHVIGVAYLFASWLSPAGNVIATAEGNTYQSWEECQEALSEFFELMRDDDDLRYAFIHDVPGASNVQVQCVNQTTGVSM